MTTLSDQEGLTPKAPEYDYYDHRWNYPEGFEGALRHLYEHSFEDCGLSPEAQSAVLDAFQSSGAGAANLGYRDSTLSNHTAEMWAVRRLDLTAEQLALSPEWKIRFPPESIDRIETRLAALYYAINQQALLEGSGGTLDLPDRRLEDAGYRVQILNKQVFLILEPIPWISGLLLKVYGFEHDCDYIRDLEQDLRRTPFLEYEIGVQHHLLFCTSCHAPIASALYGFIIADQFRRMRLFLANLVECLNFSDVKLEKMGAALQSSEQERDDRVFRNAVVWRTFLLANYLPYVADPLVWQPKPSTFASTVNVWAALLNGEGHPEATRFVRSLPKSDFDAALFAQEVLSSMPDYPDSLAFRWKDPPWRRLVIPSINEGLRNIPGFVEIQETTSTEDWFAFLERSEAEEMPWWGFEAIEMIIKLAAKAARLALAEGGMGSAESRQSERLETIANQVDAIHGGQRPTWELQIETKQGVDQLLQQRSSETDLLKQIIGQLNRPTVRHAEVSLRQNLGESVFDALTDEARMAALEAELRFLQGEYADPSVIPFQLAKAFECQLRAAISNPFKEWRVETTYPPGLGDVRRMLKNAQKDFLVFLKEKGFDHRLLQQKLDKVIDWRNQAAHTAVMTEQSAQQLREDWLGTKRKGDSIFKAFMKRI